MSSQTFWIYFVPLDMKDVSATLQSGRYIFHIQGSENIGTLCSFYTGVFYVQYLPVTNNIDVIDWIKD